MSSGARAGACVSGPSLATAMLGAGMVELMRQVDGPCRAEGYTILEEMSSSFSELRALGKRSLLL